MWQRVCAIALCVGLSGFLVWAVEAPKPTEAVKPAEVQKLIEQLGSGDFQEREAATKKLAEIGLPALEALQKATKTGELEIRTRAEQLLKGIEQEADIARILTPTKVKLSLKDVTVTEAVRELSKQSGYYIGFDDPKDVLKERKVTLQTGEVSFWEAYDQLCKQVGLVEEVGIASVPPKAAPGVIRGGGIRVVPGKAVPLPIAKPRIVAPANPVPEEKKPEDKKPEEPKKPEEKKPDEPKKPEQVEAAPPRIQLVAQQIQIEVAAPPAFPVPPPVIVPIAGQPIDNPYNNAHNASNRAIMLVPGKVEEYPTCYAGSIRIQAIPESKVTATQTTAPLPAGTIRVYLKVSLEPKLLWETLLSTQLEKAIDELKTKYEQHVVATPAGNKQDPQVGIVGGGIVLVPAIARMPGGVQAPSGTSELVVPLYLKKPEKIGKVLETLAGTLTAKIVGPTETLLTIDNLAKASGQNFKGKTGVEVKIANLTLEKKQAQVKFEIVAPEGVYVGGPSLPNVQMNVVPFGVPIAPVPAPAPGAGAGFAAAPVAAPVPVIGRVAGGFGVVGATGGPNATGLTLEDDKGNVYPITGSSMSFQAGPGGVQQTHQLTFDLSKTTVEPTKLKLVGRRALTVPIKFTLKNVPLS